jgi:membrane associated rhomboid family serine protease
MQNGSSTSDENEFQPDEPLRSIIGLFPTDRKAHEAGLAVLAAGSAYWVFPYEGQYALVVRSSEAERLETEVNIYRLRNRFWPAVSPELAEKKISALPTWTFLVFILSVFYLQGSYPYLDELGMNSSQAFRQQGAWWRIFTATTLHADLSHLTGNLFGMGLFGYFAARYLGNGLAWTGIILTAALSNLTNVFLHWDHAFLSLGASTAVFGALGLVTGFPIGSYLRSGNKINRRQWLIPLSGGVTLLAWLGSGNFPTDVAGHIWSFLYGLIAASTLARFKIHALIQKRAQRILLFLGWSLLLFSWALALASSGQ